MQQATTLPPTWLRTPAPGDSTKGTFSAATPRAWTVPVSVAARPPAAMKVRVYRVDLGGGGPGGGGEEGVGALSVCVGVSE